MRKPSFYVAGTLCLAFLVSLTSFKPAGNRPSANGQGGLTIDGHLQEFSFQANTNADGSVSGMFEVKSLGQDLRLHGTISCLTVFPDGKTASLAGVITQRVGDGLPGVLLVGDVIIFQVQDNGEGSNANDDRFSDVLPSWVAPPCTTEPFPLFRIESGNIQVKP